MGICVVSFSSRKNGNCEQISRWICSVLPQAKRYLFSDFEIHPCGNCSYECFRSQDTCPWIKDKEYELIDSIVNSTFTYFILPNYCDYPPANFFVFSERSQCYFQKHPDLSAKYEQIPKKYIVVSNTNREHFQTILAEHSADTPDILFLPAKKYGKVSLDGDLMTSEQAAAAIKEFIQLPSL